ncbi:MAG: RidA family protein [Gammaproteobacteria bacterium]|jgi:reactive intermediate/imine deaminase|nr:RidA family protein [Gammaproteobacteria bacterium]MBP6051377.1 RidA family protein [Pseudomonadales bacterium]MBK6582850.1 RidA family protein [Gammaproteobacteria bacterium]MBK7518979.1 RidA family protein [Gammaproteobacteria bacterium]MBK7730279.1 RidA family protein [Gammaproteobacteria bacterium]
MSNRAIISTGDAPQAIGPYSQAVKVNGTVYLSGQIPLDPATMQMVEGDIRAQAERVFGNLRAVASAAGGDLNQCVKINIYLTDLGDFASVNEVMARFFSEPFPARACVQVAALPRGAAIEVEATMVVPS